MPGFAPFIGGTTDDRTITLPGVTLIQGFSPQVWVEAPGDPGFNNLFINLTTQVLTLTSEAPNAGTSAF